jgi:hypothetical protein
MEPAKNGFIISYEETIKKPSSSKNTFDSPSYNYRKEVFDISEGEEAEDIKKAFDRFQELAMMEYKNLKESGS